MEKDTPYHESALFHPVLKAYPTCHSWIITAHISLGNLDKQLHMFNRQKTLAHQMLVKLQDQLLASQLVINGLLDEFPNRDNIYESYKPIMKAAVWLLKTISEKLITKKKPITFPRRCIKMAYRHSYHRR